MTQDKTRLIPFISQDRLAPYVAATGNLDAAFEMYVHNQMISSALYIPLQNLEVGLRNRVFHHEPILRRGQLSETHSDITYILECLSQDLAQWSQANDSFLRIFKSSEHF